MRPLRADDPPVIAAAFAALGWDKPQIQYERYLAGQEQGARRVWVIEAGGVFAGYVTVVWASPYPPFVAEGVPEIMDLNVLPAFRRRGLASLLLDEAEDAIAERSPVAGIGVGMTADYGAAQRLYVLRGYVPDGRGLYTGDRPVVFGEAVPVDDDLALRFTKRVG